MGLYASFPVEEDERKTEFLNGLLGLEGNTKFRRMETGLLLGKVRWLPFNQAKFPEVMRRLSSGEFDWLQLHTLRTLEITGPEWTEAFERPESVYIIWKSSTVNREGEKKTPREERFGDSGRVLVHYPIVRFDIDSESAFQARLMGYLHRAFVEQGLHYAFVNEGLWNYPIDMFGRDYRYDDTCERVPLLAFATDLHTYSYFSKERARGVFWANFLNPFHVERLGGVDRIVREFPRETVRDLGSGRFLLTAGPSPRTEDVHAVERYQRLREFLAPILLETPTQIEAEYPSQPPPDYPKDPWALKRILDRDIAKAKRAADDWTL